MEVKKIICPYCKAPVTKIGIDLGRVTCEYCNQTFIVKKENETYLEKFYRVMHEEEKRQAEYRNTEEYKQLEKERKESDKVLYIISIISLIIIFLMLLISI